MSKRSVSEVSETKDSASKKAGVLGSSKEEFLAVFEELNDEIVNVILPKYEVPKEAADYIREINAYNVPKGKLNRGLSVVDSLQAMVGERPLTKDERHDACVLGWCIEFLQAFFLVADDIMDASITRRGQPCWYKIPKVGMNAINDSLIIQACIFLILKKYFRGKPCYGDLIELFNETTWQTELGQLHDLTSQPLDGPVDLERFTPERHHLIVKYKTAFYSFYLPVACAMQIYGVSDEAAYDEAKAILLVMGEYFQVQDDYLDCYGAPEVIGKIGTDIQDNKCSWLVIQALARCTPKQREDLKANYGKDEEAKIQWVKDLYKELKIEDVYKKYEDESYATLNKMIEATKGPVPKAVYSLFLAKIFKRSK